MRNQPGPKNPRNKPAANLRLLRRLRSFLRCRNLYNPACSPPARCRRSARTAFTSSLMSAIGIGSPPAAATLPLFRWHNATGEAHSLYLDDHSYR
jgi:hypothetical protein